MQGQLAVSHAGTSCHLSIGHRAHWALVRANAWPTAGGDAVQRSDTEQPGELVRRAATGDQRAWDELVRRYTDLLWSIARGFRLGTADAADAIQTSWLRLLENLDRISDPDRVAAWLATTTRRECLKTLQRGNRERPIPAGHVTLDGVDAGPVDGRLLVAERDAQLWAAFTGMSDRCQCLLRVLMASPPPSYEAVSAALEMPIGSIGPTRARCLSRLRELLVERGDLLDTEPAGRREGRSS
jgi:RNA polymerase sigma factor (sigma-70 family)